jgi:hypothetical protein
LFARKNIIISILRSKYNRTLSIKKQKQSFARKYSIISILRSKCNTTLSLTSTIMMLNSNEHQSAEPAPYPFRDQLFVITNWNNTGVQCFESGHCAEAMARFRYALNLVTGPSSASSDSHAIGQAAGESSSAKLPLSPQPPIESTTPLRKARNFLQSDESTNQFVYAHPIELDVNPGAYSSAPMINHMILSAIIIWNMGVVFHSKSGFPPPPGGDGEQESDDSRDTRRLHKAHSLYMNSLSLVEQLLEHGSYGNAVVDLFAQALLFNLWDCCKRLNWESESDEWSGRLMRYSVSIRGYYGDSPDALAILQAQARQFAVNTILGDHMISHCVAAAA